MSSSSIIMIISSSSIIVIVIIIISSSSSSRIGTAQTHPTPTTPCLINLNLDHSNVTTYWIHTQLRLFTAIQIDLIDLGPICGGGVGWWWSPQYITKKCTNPWNKSFAGFRQALTKHTNTITNTYMQHIHVCVYIYIYIYYQAGSVPGWLREPAGKPWGAPRLTRENGNHV